MNRHAQSRNHTQSRSRVLSRSRVQPRNGAFTLVELMIVIIIIGILAGLLSVAAYNAVLAARKTRVKAEIDSLDMALKQYTTDRGEVPPCLGDLDSAAGNPTRQNKFMAHLRKAFSRFTPQNYAAIKTYVISNYGKTYVVDNLGHRLNPLTASSQDLNIDDVDHAEALVFWLGGPPSASKAQSSTTLLGWSADVSNPFKPTGSRASGGFAFDESRLVDLDQDGWPEYAPAVSSSAGPTPPYVYFDAGTYAAITGQFYPYPVKSTTFKTPQNMVSFWGDAMPYATFLPPSGGPTYVNPKTFQIISAGLDSVYGLEGHARNTRIEAAPVYPKGPYVLEGDQDNLTNFSEGTLKDAIK